MRFLFAVCLFWLCASAIASAQPLTPIAALDVPRYMGVWYEVAKYPNRFQKKCIANTRAEYRLLEAGKVQVINRCQQSNGEMVEAVGEARQMGAVSSAKLQVRFAPAWLSALPFVWGNYWVIDLDSNYQLAAVSEPNKEYLWILSRQPQVPSEVYNALLQRLKAQGFDLERIELSQHSPQ